MLCDSFAGGGGAGEEPVTCAARANKELSTGRAMHAFCNLQEAVELARSSAAQKQLQPNHH